MGRPMNYDTAAASYAAHRWALPWKLQPLLDAVTRAPARDVLEVGVGTGDYLVALHDRVAAARYAGFDRSPAMIAHARARCPWAASLELADADHAFPAAGASLDVVYAVDVLHHLQNYDCFFAESARTLRPRGTLVVITDSRDDIHARSLATCFPTTLAPNHDRYPPIEDLVQRAGRHGFVLADRRTVSGIIDLDDRFLAALDTRSLSELRLISDEDHRLGMQEVHRAARSGERWRSQTTALTWTHDDERSEGAPMSAAKGLR